MTLFVILACPGSALAANSGNFTISIWVNPSTSIASKAILTKAEEFRIATNSSGNPLCQTKTTTWQTAATASQGLTLSAWSHVVCTYDLTTLSLYVNGILKAQTALTAIPNDTAAIFYAARDASSGSTYGFFQGLLDEYKFYNYALTGDEVKIDYNQGLSLSLGSSGNNTAYASNASNQEYCVPGDATSCAGPIGEWRFDEGSGGTVNDTSGNGYTGSWQGTLGNQWKAGKIGTAGNFNGLDNEVTTTTGPILSTNATIEGWFYWQSGANALIRDYTGSNGWILAFLGGSTLYFRVGDTQFNTNIDITPYQNKWTHYAVTKNGGAVNYYLNGTLVYTGSGAGSTPSVTGWHFMRNASYAQYAKGLADDIKMFNYARTPSQIAWDYNKGKPVGWWQMNECTGNTLYDASGNSYSATLTVGATIPQTSAGTCTDGLTTSAWYNGRTGKYSASINLDGVDDYAKTLAISPLATAAQTTTKLSWGGWFYPTTSTASKYLMEKATNSTTAGEFHLYTDSNSMPICGIFYSGAFHDSSAPTQGLTLSAWNHVLCTYDGTNINTYLNGRLIKQSSETNNVTAVSSILYLGEASAGTSLFEGKLDDLRVYNYALTGTQAETLYNEGFAVRFGPNAGSP